MRRLLLALTTTVALLLCATAGAATVPLGSRTFDQACNAAAGGDVITVAAGTFPAQTITCTKAVTFQGAGPLTKVGYVAFSKANGPTVAGMKLTAGAESKSSKNVAITGSTINNLVYIEGSADVLLEHNVHEPASSGTSWSNGDMVDVYEQTGKPTNTRITIQDSVFHGLRAPSPSAHSDAIQFCNCSSAGASQHPDGIRILRNKFYDNECMNVRSNERDGILFENNLVGDTVTGISGCGAYSLDLLAANATVRYNTFTGKQQIQVNTTADYGQSQTWIGNAGVGMSTSCGAIRGTYSHNVWTAQKCSASDLQVPSLKIGSDGTPLAGSPLIDAGDPLTFPASDLSGATRPRGAFADVGAIETGASTPPPPPPADQDGDGVPDSTDACPTGAGTQADGCNPALPPPSCADQLAKLQAELDHADGDLAATKDALTTARTNLAAMTDSRDQVQAIADAYKARAEKAEDQVARIKQITGE